MYYPVCVSGLPPACRAGRTGNGGLPVTPEAPSIPESLETRNAATGC